MSCQIRLSANIHDIAAIRRCLFPTDDHRGSDNWLQNIEASVSPTGDIIALGNDRRLVILTSKWDSSLSLSQFLVTYSGSIHEYDKIKAVICLPIVGQSQSSHVGPDWTCIMIGYDSGFVRFYTENCELLYEEQLHIENISSISCQSQHSPRPDISPNLHPEEIYVQYQSNVCVISGPLLFQHLRACRSQLARVQAKGDTLEMPPLNLNLKKWGFQEQATINKSAVVGLNLSSTFDHLLTASTCGGFDSKYRAIAPHNTLVMAVGSKPFVGYHYALEGGAQPVFSDVAKAVASKLKSALPGWLTGNKAPQEKQMTIAMQPAEAMGCRFGLCDLRRTANDIILSPDRKLAAVSDALGRVLLIDAYRGVTVRIFKGYRDAQMSFIQVPDERKSKHKIGNRVALFLIIYSPRRGTLEIFSVQQGTKIATFTASKHSRLLYIDYGLMGFVTTSKSKYICQYTTVFVDGDGQIKEILIPFHFALTEKNNKRAKDLHLYKKLRALIKSGDFDTEKLSVEAKNTYTELKTSEIRLQTVDLLLNNKDVPAEISLECVEYFIEKFKEEPELEDNNLKVLVTNAGRLLKLFMFLKLSTNLDAENGNSDTQLDIPTKELGNLQKLLDLSTMTDNMKKSETRVKFVDDNTSSLQDFSSVFNLTEANRISLKPNLEDQQILRASEVAFKKYITGDANNYDELQEKIVESRIVIKDLFYLLVFYWVNRTLYMHLNLEKEMGNLSSVIYCIVRSEDKEDVLTDYNGVSKFWSEVRDILALSSRPFPALTAAILCKNIAQKYDVENDMDKSVTSFEDDSVLSDNIEVLSQENILWSILIGKLEDVSLLNIILSNDPIASDCTLPKLSHEKVDVCLKYVLQKGRGAVSELVAKWLTKCGINPRNIVINDYIYQKSLEDEETVKEAVEDETIYTLEELEYVRAQPVFDHINRLKSQFPYNLETSNLLANLCWEYALAWHKDIQLLENLEACVRCLDAVRF